ncbi:MAG: hypothetical protein AB7U85_06040 [Alphaproteobacteria bacterium]
MDWNILKNKTAKFNSIQVVSDLEETSSISEQTESITEIIASGLCFSLSELLAKFPKTGGSLLSVYADTLLVDCDEITASGLVICVRSLDVSPLKGKALKIKLPEIASDGIAEFMIGSVLGGNGILMVNGSSFTPAADMVNLKPFYLNLAKNKPANIAITDDSATVQDLTCRGLATNSLRACLSAAIWLVDSSDKEQQSQAQAMLQWIMVCIQSLKENISSDTIEIYNNAAALLVSSIANTNAHFVPVLSSELYYEQINTLVDALIRYEDNYQTLDISKNIKNAVGTIGGVLEKSTLNEIKPLETEFQSISENIKSLRENISSLNVQFLSLQSTADAKLAILKAEVETNNIRAFLDGSFDFVSKAVKLGKDIVAVKGGDISKIGNVVSELIETVKAGDAAISAINAPSLSDSNLLKNAKTLIQVQQQVAISFQTGCKIWSDITTKMTKNLPQPMAEITINPDLAWQNYLLAAEEWFANLPAKISSLKSARAYLNTLKLITNYGQAVNSATVTLASQMARGAVVAAQISATKDTAKLWKNLNSSAKNDEERLVILKGVLQSRIDSLKQSIFVAWRNYRESYFYLYFSEPPISISLDMNGADFKDAVAKMKQWIACALGDVPNYQQIKLPNNEVRIEFSYPIVKAEELSDMDIEKAILISGNGNAPARIFWTIPIESSQLKGVLPNNGKVAIWIKDAQFFLDGALANNKGNIMAKVSTSGSYLNGFGTKRFFSFVTKNMVGDYAYAEANKQVYNPWSIPNQVYMTPTPFTQWEMAFEPDGGNPNDAKQLRMILQVAYKTE